MIRVRILHPTVARLVLQPGDEIQQQAMTPELEAFLSAHRSTDGALVAEIIEGDEAAVLVPSEAAVVRGRRRGGA